MPTAPSLKILLEHAQKQSDASAKKLGQLNFHRQEAEKKLQMLLQYRQNYQSHFQDAAKKGLDQIKWHNFIMFLSKLDAAITEQQQSVIDTNRNSEAGGTEFLAHQRKLKSYNTLSQRHQQIKIQKQSKYEQKEQDEYAANTAIHNQHVPKL